jgi:hypothetical protein
VRQENVRLQKDLEKVKRNQAGTQRNTSRISDIKKDTECFKCGQKGHWKRECKEQKRRRPQTEETPVKSAARHDLQTKFLVDTGATVSLVSNKIFYALDKSKRPEVGPLRQTVVSANGTDLTSMGQAFFNLTVGTQQCTVEAVIADLPMDGILGLDFIQSQRCVIDLESNVMRYANQEIPLYFEGRIGCFRVTVKENISIQPGTEMIVKGFVQDAPKLRKDNKWAMLEPCEMFLKRDCALVAKVLVEPKDCVPVRLMNVTDAVQIVRSGTTVAELSPVECVLNETKIDRKGQTFHDLDNELMSLVERSSKHLPKDKTETVRSLINEYKDLFATSDQDLGRTNIVRHKVNTGSNIPVKQPPRRTPIAMRAEVDKHIDEMLRVSVC